MTIKPTYVLVYCNSVASLMLMYVLCDMLMLLFISEHFKLGSSMDRQLILWKQFRPYALTILHLTYFITCTTQNLQIRGQWLNAWLLFKYLLFILYGK